jgi:peptidase M23-like protein
MRESRMTVMAALALVAAVAVASRDVQPEQPISASVVPASPYIEVRDGEQRLTFDLVLHNNSQTALKLVAIREAVYDSHGKLELEREINGNGVPSALSGLGDLLLQADGYKDIFQPFGQYAADMSLDQVQLTLIFLKPEKPTPPVALTGDVVVRLDVRPQAFQPQAYCLPLGGMVLVHDGHDLASHHRRRDLARVFGANAAHGVNANLYAYDFVRVGPHGELFGGDAGRKENWLTFGAPVLSPTDGTVLEAVDEVADNTFVGGSAKIPEAAESLDPRGLGNHVLIKSKDGRVSWLLHLEAGTIAVRAGQVIKQGTAVGQVGFSGDSLFPHLHYNATNGASYPSQGVPSYFGNFVRVLGSRRAAVGYGQVDTGDIVLRGVKPSCR